jgi:hypothetical protein
MRRNPHSRLALGVSAVLLALALALAASALAASAPRVTSRSWEVAQGGNLHDVSAGGKFTYCVSQPVNAITPVVAYTHAPVGKSFTVKMAGPAASGTVPFGVKTPFTKSSGRLNDTYATISFPGRQIVAGAYTFTMQVGGKTFTSLKLTLAARTGC